MRAKIYKIKLKKGDNVVVLSGKDKGKTGKVIATHPRLNKVTVEGINVVKRHLKPTREVPQGGIIDKTRPIWVSKVAILNPNTKVGTKIGIKVDSDGKKTRIYKDNLKEVK